MLSFSTRLSGGDVARSSDRAHEGWGRFVICFGHCDIAHFALIFGLGRARARSSSRKQRGRRQDDRFAHGTSPLITSRTRSASAQDRTSAFESSPARVAVSTFLAASASKDAGVGVSIETLHTPKYRIRRGGRPCRSARARRARRRCSVAPVYPPRAAG